MNTKIFFTDLDGTLLNDRKEITPGNQKAIDQALVQGHKIVVATGRPLASARVQIEKLGLTREGCYAITYNGAQILDTHTWNTLYAKPLPFSMISSVFELAKEMGLHIHTYSSTHVISEHDCPEIREYSETTIVPLRIVPDIMDALDSEPFKMLAIERYDHAKIESFRQEVLRRYGAELESFFSSADYLEIVSNGITKGFAVRWMCEFLGIPIENSVAAGDAQNDISMLEAAQVGAVMCNAFPGIAEHGSYLTEADNNHDGVAEIIRRFILS